MMYTAHIVIYLPYFRNIIWQFECVCMRRYNAGDLEISIRANRALIYWDIICLCTRVYGTYNNNNNKLLMRFVLQRVDCMGEAMRLTIQIYKIYTYIDSFVWQNFIVLSTYRKCHHFQNENITKLFFRTVC